MDDPTVSKIAAKHNVSGAAVMYRFVSMHGISVLSSWQVGWVRATMCITELQGLVTNGLWDNADDECRSHMKAKLAAVGLKLPKISVAGHCSDVAPGERVAAA